MLQEALHRYLYFIAESVLPIIVISVALYIATSFVRFIIRAIIREQIEERAGKIREVEGKAAEVEYLVSLLEGTSLDSEKPKRDVYYLEDEL